MVPVYKFHLMYTSEFKKKNVVKISMFLMSMIVMEPVGVCASGPLCVSSKVKSERTKVLQKPDKYENHLPSQGWKKV